jgi:hypothetical protein
MRVLGRQGGAAIHQPMEAATRDRLSALFAEDIEELETMFDLDLSTWRRRES